MRGVRTLYVAALLWTLSGSAEELPTGRVIERMACSEQPANSYALYLPSGYTATRKWPVVYAMDARYRALVPMSAFRAAAERLGVIIVSSYDTSSDGDSGPSVAAMRAMWSDTHRRLSIDDHRVYLAGFSGTVRTACYLALSAPVTITGIIGAGAGFPSDRRPGRDTPFLFFGTAGVRDFNYVELNDLDAELAALRLPHRIEFFEGTHQWMPPELAGEALDWMEVRAMAAGIREKDPKLVEALWSADLNRARALESSGNSIDAARLYAAMAMDYAPLRDVSDASAAAARLRQFPEYPLRMSARQRALRTEKDYLALAQKTLASTIGADAAIGQLRIASLRKDAAGTGEQSLAAVRMLASLFVQTGYYIPRQMVEEKKYARAVFFLTIAAAIRPEEAEVHYDLAAVDALANDPRESLRELRRAVSLGFHDANRIEHDPDFASLRGNDELKAIVAGMRATR